jgi:hypothetical protein
MPVFQMPPGSEAAAATDYKRFMAVRLSQPTGEVGSSKNLRESSPA